jgi:hypothetical protein
MRPPLHDPPEKEDFSDEAKLKLLADAVKMKPDEFRQRFEYVV